MYQPKESLKFQPKIVAIGGGHGLSNLLRGLKEHTEHITAVVTVTDDGGGSGMLRQDLGMLPPGDIRNCMQALSNTEAVMEQLLDFRFAEGSLAGQSFGNLLLAALNCISDSFDQAVTRMSEVLALTGRVLPVTNADIVLEAFFANGSCVVGESKIFRFQQEQGCDIAQINLIPGHPPALPQVLEAIDSADMIVLAPGSLYTSIIPNLLVDGVVEHIAQSTVPKVYVCNIMTEVGETQGYTVSDHIKAIFHHGNDKLIDLCLVNSAPIPTQLLERYQQEAATPLVVDEEEITSLGVELLARPLVSPCGTYAHHDAGRLAQVLMELYRERGDTKIF